MRKRKLLALTMATALCATSLFGCSKAEKEDTTSAAEEEKITATITVWGPAEDQAADKGKWLQTMCEKFNEEHKNWDITFKYGTCSEGDAAKTVTQDPANSGDVYFFANDQLQSLIDANAIAKLGGDTAQYVKDTNTETIVKSVTVNDSIYGVPFTTNTWFMYYDKSKITDEESNSLDTMLTKGKVAFPLTNSWYIASYYLANGGTMFGNDGLDNDAGIKFGGDKGAAVTDYLVSLAANKNFVNDSQGVGLSGLRDGSVAALFSGSWDAASVKEILGDNFGVRTLPTVKIGDKDLQLKSFAGSKAIAVNPNCKYQQVAVALAKYLGGKEAQLEHYKLRNVIPCNSELLETDEIKNDVLVSAQNDTFNKTSIIQPFVSGMANYWTPAENFGKSIINGEVTHDNAATKTEEFNKSLNTAVVK